MTTLLYRGHAYQQVKDAAPQQGVQLTYRRNEYQARQADVRQAQVQLTNRGVSYLRRNPLLQATSRLSMGNSSSSSRHC